MRFLRRIPRCGLINCLGQTKYQETMKGLLKAIAKRAPDQKTPKGLQKTPVCGRVIQNPNPKPTSQRHDGLVGRFKCGICGGTRKDHRALRMHFKQCVADRGNPDGIFWDDNESCGLSNIAQSMVDHAQETRRRRQQKKAGGRT